MSAAIWGGALGGVAAVGLLTVVVRVVVLRRPQLDVRVLPYLRDVPLRDQPRMLQPAPSSPTSAAAGIFGPVLHSAADLVERVLGGSTSVRRRLQRAGLDRSVQDFRIEQVVWGLTGFGAAAAIALLRALGRRRRRRVGSGVLPPRLRLRCLPARQPAQHPGEEP